MPGRSYAEMMSRPSALRKPLLYTPASSAVRPASSPRRRLPPPLRTRLSTTAIADSPRRLLSYYLSKAAYNTDAGESEGDGIALANASNGDVTIKERRERVHEGQSATEDERKPLPSYSAASLRSPPLQSTQSNTGTSSTLSPPAPHHHSAGTVLPSKSGITQRGTASWQGEKRSDFSESRTLAACHTSLPSAPTAASSLLSAHASLPPARAPFMSHLDLYTEEQHRVFEAQVMEHVEALLQAQRNESHAELESYRVMAAEAQATLHAVETALKEQIGDVQCSSSGKVGGPGRRVNGPLGDCVSHDRPSSTSNAVSPLPFAQSVDALVLNMSRVAAAAATPATEKLLDAIMSIRDGEHVPAALRRVVEHLYNELARALVPPVMDFVNQQHQLRHEQRAAAAIETRGPGAHGTRNDAVRDADEVLRAKAEVAALQEEAQALRRTLRSQEIGFVDSDASPTGGLASSTSPMISSNAQIHPSQEELIWALQNRLFSEYHAMLARSSHEALLLRCSLEEERRQHFLTRLRLLKPAHPFASHRSSNATSNAAAAAGHAGSHSAPARARIDLGHSEGIPSSPKPRSGSGSSPLMHGSSATRSPTSSVSDADGLPHSQARVPTSQSAGSLLSAAHRTVPHRWTPVHSPLQLASESGMVDEHDGNGCFGDNPPAEQSHAPRYALSPSRQLPSAGPSRAAPRTAVSLENAMRVAEQVLCSTAPVAPSNSEPSHPYDSKEPGGVAGAWQQTRSGGDVKAAPVETGEGASFFRRCGERHGPSPRARERSVVFNDPAGPSNHDAGCPSPSLLSERLMRASLRPELSESSFARALGGHGGDASTGADPISSFARSEPRDGSAATIAGAAPAPSADAYERRVWNKTVELLSRYSIA
ncbi:hypothetical protein GH5_03253 [Leishmania sp. Ghana 2012 LV757]|uniref:hypothetical protein n=1 Tax=Leishmania sp. Ghana 2012 LV757 TaxID=2803181 RepID=UPI001B63F796|nr:hypothetical protein GH5_03253 [Leishmania sp. Ghana 2012 LV757]